MVLNLCTTSTALPRPGSRLQMLCLHRMRSSEHHESLGVERSLGYMLLRSNLILTAARRVWPLRRVCPHFLCGSLKYGDMRIITSSSTLSAGLVMHWVLSGAQFSPRQYSRRSWPCHCRDRASKTCLHDNRRLRLYVRPLAFLHKTGY